MTLAEEKTALRKAIRIQRKLISNKAERDEQLLLRIQAHSWMREADTVLVYYSGTFEPDTRVLINHMLRSCRKIALPVCDTEGNMQFFLLHSTAELQPGAYGIPEPSGREAPVLTGKSLCIVPGLAFTEHGERLGQGGGYYDRFLQTHRQIRTIGLTYQCLIQTALPCGAHDCRVDVVMTESGCFPEISGGI